MCYSQVCLLKFHSLYPVFLALFPYWSVCYCQVCILFLCSISRSVRYSKVCVLFQGLYAIPICVLFPSPCAIPCPFQLSPFTTWVGGGKMTDDSAEILLQSFLQEATVSSSGMGQDVHSLTLSIQHFLCQPQHRPPSKVPWEMVLERLLWRVTCSNHASFCLLTVARRGSCVPARKFILLRNQSLVLCSEGGDVEKVPHALGFESLDTFFFSESASRVLVSQP